MSGIFNTYYHNYPIIRDSHDQPRHLKLVIIDDINKTVYTGKTFQELGISLQVALIDETSGFIVKTGPESSLQVEFVVLHKDFNQDNWTTEEFDRFIIESDDRKQRKNSPLREKPRLVLREGLGTAREISFKHTNRHMKKSEFRLGARVSNPVLYGGVRIKEAKSKPFTVKDKRIMSEKINPASPDHEVWRLYNISKDGPYHRRLKGGNINTVKDFLTEHDRNPDNLRRNIMQMKSTKRWDATVNHAKTSQPKEILGQYPESTFVPIDQLTNSQMAFLPQLMVSASEDSDNLVIFDCVNDDSFEQLLLHMLPPPYIG